jgi:hypothetical protein
LLGVPFNPPEHGAWALNDSRPGKYVASIHISFSIDIWRNMHEKSSYHEIFVDETAPYGPCRAQANKTCGITIFSFLRVTTSIKTGTQTSVGRELSQSEKRKVLFSEQRSDDHCPSILAERARIYRADSQKVACATVGSG